VCRESNCGPGRVAATIPNSLKYPNATLLVEDEVLVRIMIATGASWAIRLVDQTRGSEQRQEPYTNGQNARTNG